MPVINTDTLLGAPAKLKTDRATFRPPYGCVIPGTCNSIDNSRGALHYCDECQARLLHRRCIRDLARIEQQIVARAKQARERQANAKKARTPYNNIARHKRQSQTVYGEPLRACAVRRCWRKTTGKHCRHHAAVFRERSKRMARAIAHARVDEAKIDRVIARKGAVGK